VYLFYGRKLEEIDVSDGHKTRLGADKSLITRMNSRLKQENNTHLRRDDKTENSDDDDHRKILLKT